MRKKMGNVTFIAMVGVMGAVCFATNYLSIPLPTPSGATRIHFGNSMCLLSGLILGPIPGGIAAGVGSMFYDFTNPVYFTSAPFTLVSKFAMAYLCGAIAWQGGAQGKKRNRNIVAAVVGQLAYIVLYLSKNFIVDVFFSRLEMQTALLAMRVRAGTSTINAVVAVVLAVPLALALRKGLEQAHLRGLENIR